MQLVRKALKIVECMNHMKTTFPCITNNMWGKFNCNGHLINFFEYSKKSELYLLVNR